MTRTIALLLAATTIAFCQKPTHPSRDHNVDPLRQAPASLVLKEAPALRAVDPVVVLHGPRTKRFVALTFDACSTHRPSQYNERITNILVENRIAATFFLGGKWMEEEPEQTKYLSSIPYFELANHTFLHPHLIDMSDDRIRQELLRTQEVMFSFTGTQSTLFRPPYGEVDDRIVRVAASLGLTTVQFDLASGDPDSSISKQKLIEYVSTMAKNGSIIVMHINGRGWHTAEALPEIISRLRKRGFTFVTVGEMISQQQSSSTAKEKARE